VVENKDIQNIEDILEDCLNREKWGGKRATLMKAIEARIRKLGRTTKEV